MEDEIGEITFDDDHVLLNVEDKNSTYQKVRRNQKLLGT